MPRVFHVTDFREGVRHMLAPAVALIPFGLVCGVAANAAGASVWAAFGLSAIVFSGAAQILAAELYAAGAPASVIVFACSVIGPRLVMYSAALAPQFARALRYVAVAMLTALVLPMVLAPHGGAMDWGNPRVPATLVAGTVAFATRSTRWTVVAGMAALWALQFLMD